MTTPAAEHPLISVVVPCHRCAATLPELLDSLVAQDLQGPFEVVIVLDRCDDGSEAIVRSYAGRLRVRAVESDRPGAGAARNRGVVEAAGARLACIDADDVADPSWLSSLQRALDTSPLVGGSAWVFGAPPGLVAARFSGSPSRWFGERPFLPYAQSNNLAFHRSVWEAVGGFDETFEAAEDVAFSWRAQLAGFPLGVAEDARVGYRLRPDRRSTVRQLRSYAAGQAQLFSQFRTAGMSRSSVLGALAKWVWLVVHLPDTLRSDDRRDLWWTRFAMRVGRLEGSWRHRVLYP